jgi:hypothetical protein
MFTAQEQDLSSYESMFTAQEQDLSSYESMASNKK